MKIRLILLTLFLCLASYINLSMYFGPFTDFEKNVGVRIKKEYAQYQRENYISHVAREAERGDPEFQFLYAFSFLKNDRGQYDQDKAIYWFEKSGDNGYLDAYHKIAYGLDNGAFGFSKDYDKDKILVEKFYRKAADKGFGKSQNNLAIFLINKHENGEEVDLEEIRRLRLVSAEGGDLHAIGNLAVVYFNGLNGFEKDYGKALYWYKKLYYNGRGAAKTLVHIAWIYDQKDGPDYNPRKAGYFYWQAARQGNVYAMKKVAAAYYYKHYGYPRDRDEGFKWYLKAAELGDEWTQSWLGRHYKRKIKSARSIEKKNEYKAEAIKWFTKSAEQGNEESKDQIELLNKEDID